MSPQSNHLDTLQTAIQLKHQCRPTHRETVFVHEKTEKNETIWKGYVEVFDLTGHKEATTCYAWQQDITKGIRIITVLGNHVVNSPHRAIQGAIFAGVQLPTRKSPEDLKLLKKRIVDAEILLHETEINTEVLDAAIQPSIENGENIKQRRKSSN